VSRDPLVELVFAVAGSAGARGSKAPSLGLRGAILDAIALGGALTGRELSIRLGRPEPVRFYDLLAELIEAGLVETDPRSCRYYLPGGRP